MRIPREDLGLKPYHIRLIHKLSEDDFDRRVEFCETFFERLAQEPDLVDRVLWSDEAIFSLSETINRHNCVYLEKANPNISKDVDNLGSDKVIVWAGVWSGARNGPFFFNSSMNAASYLTMLQNEAIPALSHIENFQDHITFQQDGAPAHYAVSVRRYLDETFTEWMGRRGTIEWPARSPDLMVEEFFLWG